MRPGLPVWGLRGQCVVMTGLSRDTGDHHGDTRLVTGAITPVCHPIRRIYGAWVEMILGAPQGTDLKRTEFNPGHQYPNKTRHLGQGTWVGKKCEQFI